MCLQYGDDNKGPMLIAIARFFNIKDLSCLTLLDDKIHNGVSGRHEAFWKQG